MQECQATRISAHLPLLHHQVDRDDLTVGRGNGEGKEITAKAQNMICYSGGGRDLWQLINWGFKDSVDLIGRCSPRDLSI